MMPLDGTAIPGPFCWTKMQAEAGEPIEGIVNRKELERSITAQCVFGYKNHQLREWGRSFQKMLSH